MTTIADIARESGVSTATVSRVMNRPDIVAAGTRNLVEATIERLDYRPKRVARALRTQRFSSVALAVGDSSNPFFARLGKVLQAVGDEHESTVMVYDLDHRPHRLLEFVRRLPGWGVDGAVILTGDDLAAIDGFAELVETVWEAVPIITGQQVSGLPAVVSDHREAGFRAALHLADVGVRRPMFMGMGDDSAVSRLRWEGFAGGVQQAGLGHPQRVESAFSYQSGYESCLRVAQGDFDGILAANDQVALGVIRALFEAGRHVPDDVAVIGFDGLGFSPFVRPSLSTMQNDHEQLGRAIGQLLFEQIADRDRSVETVVVEHQLVIRESTSRRGIA